MKPPKPPGTPIDAARMQGWTREFGNYRIAITETRIDRWLSQFELPDLDLGARVLDCVDFVPNEKISAVFRSSLNAMPGWDRNATRRTGQWRFAAFSSSAGESGDVMLQKFRHANNLASKAFNSLFVHRSELLSSGLSHGDTIVFVDDFAGTGTQATDAWPMLAELLPEGPDVHLILVAATREALTRVALETDLLIQADIVLTPEDAIFADACKRFSDSDKQTLRKYCKKAVSASAEGFAEDGYVIVFSHTCPNNTLPILHANRASWEGLFRRYD